MTNTREKLIDVFMHMGDHIQSLDEYGFGFDSTLAKAIEDVVAMLKQPDANDVVSVVRCKDCKHFVAPQGVSVCACFCGLGFAEADDFCSYGERKDNEH